MAAAEAARSPEEMSGATERVVIREWHRVHLVRPDHIDWIEADDNNIIARVGERIYKGRGRISDLESQLDPDRFARIHRSAIVRVECIAELLPLARGGLAVRTHDGKMMRVSRSRRAALATALGVKL